MFSGWDLEDINSPHDDALVIKVQIFNAMVSHVLVVKIFFKDKINRISILDNITKSKTLPHTFSKTPVQSLRMVKLAIQE